MSNERQTEEVVIWFKNGERLIARDVENLRQSSTVLTFSNRRLKSSDPSAGYLFSLDQIAGYKHTIIYPPGG